MVKGRSKITRLLRPYWASLALASAAVAAEGAADLLEPWPLKIVFDYVIGPKRMTGWLAAEDGRAFVRLLVLLRLRAAVARR